MSLYSQTQKNLVSGVSQQPAILRYPEQLEVQENGFPSEVGGLQKRPPTLHVRTIDKTVFGSVKPLVHVIYRDENEKYLVVFNGTGVHIWDNLGNAKTVTYDNAAAQDYVTTNSPRSVLKMVTVADHTFIINTTTEVALGEEVVTDVWAGQGALVNVKQGQYGRTYSITINDSTIASYQTPDGSAAENVRNIDTNYIATILKNGAVNNGWSVDSGESWLCLTKTGVTITSIETKDGFNNQAMFGFTKSAQKFSNLPATAPDGYTVEILGESGKDADNYYVKYDATKRVWKECAKPGVALGFDSTTMPHILVRNADGTFTLKQATWTQRKAGDDDSNPQPSFVGATINDVFFFRNRLGLLSGENQILSKSGEFFQFWMSSAMEILDTDPIDVSVSHTDVSILENAVPFSDELITFADKSQFILRADGVLSPKNARVDHLTDFEYDSGCKPVSAGRRIYFPSKRALYSSINEFYTVQDVTNVKDSVEITSHVPSYIPNGVHKLIPSTSEHIVLTLTEGSPGSIFIYKYLFSEDTRLQSAWSEWKFGADTEILGGGFIGSTFYMVTKRDQEYNIEKMLFTYNTKDFTTIEPYRVFIDRKVLTPVITSEAYYRVPDETVVDIQSLYGSLVTTENYGLITPDGLFIRFTTADLVDGKLKVRGDWTGKQLIIGALFKFRLVFTELMVKTQDDKGVKAETEGRLQVKDMWVNYENSGYFKAIVECLDKDTFEYEMTARILGSGRNKLGEMPLESGEFKFAVKEDSKKCVISIESDAPTPIALIGSGWRGNYQRRTQRI